MKINLSLEQIITLSKAFAYAHVSCCYNITKQRDNDACSFFLKERDEIEELSEHIKKQILEKDDD